MLVNCKVNTERKREKWWIGWCECYYLFENIDIDGMVILLYASRIGSVVRGLGSLHEVIGSKPHCSHCTQKKKKL